MRRRRPRQLLDVLSQRGLVVLDGRQVVRALFQHQSARALGLGVQGLETDFATVQVELLVELAGHGDFVGFGVHDGAAQGMLAGQCDGGRHRRAGAPARLRPSGAHSDSEHTRTCSLLCRSTASPPLCPRNWARCTRASRSLPSIPGCSSRPWLSAGTPCQSPRQTTPCHGAPARCSAKADGPPASETGAGDWPPAWGGVGACSRITTQRRAHYQLLNATETSATLSPRSHGCRLAEPPNRPLHTNRQPHAPREP
jgi:hypothetical protein